LEVSTDGDGLYAPLLHDNTLRNNRHGAEVYGAKASFTDNQAYDN